MKPFTKKHKFITLGVVALLLAGYGYHRYALKHFKPRLTTQEQTHMATLFTDPTTYCFGRYLIDLPRDFTVTKFWVLLDNEEILIHPSYLPVYEQKIKLRQQALEQTQPKDKINAPYLKGIHPITGGGKGVIFERNYTDIAQDRARVLELYAYQDGLLIETKLKATNGSAARYDELRKDDESFYRNDVNQKLGVLKNLLSRITKRDENLIPRTAGLCLPYAFLADPNESEQSFGWVVESDKYPSIRISFNMYNRLKEVDSMLERSSAINKLLAPLSVTDLRKQAFTLHGQQAEEWLLEDLHSKRNAKRLFSLILNEKEGGDRTPYISMDLTQALPDKTLSQAEVVELWDTIRSTLRFRPGAL